MKTWSHLQPDLLEEIARRLPIRDFVHLKSICKPWHSAIKHTHTKPETPWLFFPEGLIYSFAEGAFGSFHMPKAGRKHGALIRGSCYGWLVIMTARGPKPSCFLLNPLTNKQINLPSVTTLPNVLGFHPLKTSREYLIKGEIGRESYFCNVDEFELRFGLKKVILSGNPSLDEKWVAVAIYGDRRHLAFARPGDSNWTPIRTESRAPLKAYDIVVWKEKLYVLRLYSTDLGVISIKENQTLKMEVLKLKSRQEIPVRTIIHNNYLVVSSSGDDLLLVSRELEPMELRGSVRSLRTKKFLVHKLHQEEESTVMVWKKIHKIGDTNNDIIFLGINLSICLPARDYPECEANCIYYTDDCAQWYRHRPGTRIDTGIFNIVQGQSRPLPTSTTGPAPLWLTPSLS